MRVHYLQHVPFEGLANIAPWLAARNATISRTCLFADPTLPDVGDFDWLIVMGGPMGVHDTDAHPWLGPERAFIAETVARGKTVLGICLGAQLLAAALGAEVFRNDEPEIGWFPVEPVAGRAASDDLGTPFSATLDAFHWHSDTFRLPDGAAHLARSAACEHQAFRVGERVLGLQFHLEMTSDGARALVEHCGDELRPGRWVQSRDELAGDATRFARANAVMDDVLDRLYRATL